MCVHIKRIEKISNEEIRTMAGVTNISQYIRETRLRWLGHVERKTEEDVVMGTWKMEGRPKLRWSDVIRKDMNEKQVKIEEAQEWRTWRLKTQSADPKYGKGRRRRQV